MSSTRGASGSDAPVSSVPVSKKNETHIETQPYSQICDEISNNLRYVPGDKEDDPLVFLKGLFPILEETAKT